MKYGDFTAEGRKFRINTPATPTEWTNYLFNDNYLAEISQTLKGKSAVVDNYSRQDFTDGYRNFYISDENNVFSLSDIPEEYFCEHGLGETRVHMEKGGILADISVFVPIEARCEVWSVKLTNQSEETKKINLFSVIPFEQNGPMGGSVRYTDGFIYKYSFPYHVYYEDKKRVENNKAYYYMYSDRKPDSYEGDSARFYGCADINCVPEAVRAGACKSLDSEGDGPFIGAMQHTCNLRMQNTELGAMLEKKLGKPVNLENDANAAALGKYAVNGDNADIFVLITLGTGVGGGVIIYGKPYRGFNCAGGELGHIIINAEGEEQCS